MLKLTVYSPERRLIEGAEVSSVTLQGDEGQIEILPGHAHMIGTLETGPFAYSSVNGTETKGVISSGFFEVNGDQVTITAETLELASEIDVHRAKAAQKKAELALSDPALEPSHFRKYQLKLQRALIRQQTAGRALH